MADKSIQRAIKHKGAAAAKAKAEGLSVEEWAKKHQNDKGATGKLARLAMALDEADDDADPDGEEPTPPAPAGGMRQFH